MYYKQKFGKFNLTKNNLCSFTMKWTRKRFRSLKDAKKYVKMEANETEETPEASQPSGHSKHVVKFFVTKYEQTFVYIYLLTQG